MKLFFIYAPYEKYPLPKPFWLKCLKLQRSYTLHFRIHLRSMAVSCYPAINAAGAKTRSAELDRIVDTYLGQFALDAQVLPDGVHPNAWNSWLFGQEIGQFLSNLFKSTAPVHFFGDSSLCSTDGWWKKKNGSDFCNGASENRTGETNISPNWGDGVKTFAETIANACDPKVECDQPA